MVAVAKEAVMIEVATESAFTAMAVVAAVAK